MKHTQTIPKTFLGVRYVSDRAGLPFEAVRVPVPQPASVKENRWQLIPTNPD